MVRNIIAPIVLSVFTLACHKGKIGDETTITVQVSDPTTGQTNEKIVIELWEEKSSLVDGSYNAWGHNYRTVESFTVDFGETFDYSFKTRRRDRFTYGLQIVSAGSLIPQEHVSKDVYSTNAQLSVEKGTDLFYEVSLIPASSGKFVIIPTFQEWHLDDSIGVTLSDGKYIYSNGIVAGTRDSWLFEVPHGHYTLTYGLFDRATKSPKKTFSLPLYLRHNNDTTLELKFQ